MLAATETFAARSSARPCLCALAATKAVALDGRVRKAGAKDWNGETAVVDRIKLFDGLFVYLVQIAPEGDFPAGTLLAYSLGTVEPNGDVDDTWFEAMVEEDGLAYPGSRLPTLYLQAPGAKLNVLYASCRKPHDTDGGDNDAMTYGDSLIEGKAEVIAAPTISTIAKKLEGSSPKSCRRGSPSPARVCARSATEREAGFVVPRRAPSRPPRGQRTPGARS